MTGDEMQIGDVPSKRRNVLIRMQGRRLVSLVRYSWWAPEEALGELGSQISPEAVFSLTAGPILMILDNGLEVGAASDPAKASVVLWVERNEQGERRQENSITNDRDLFPIDARNELFCSDRIRATISDEIRSISIIKRDAKNSLHLDLPREAGVTFSFKNGTNLVLSHGLHDDSDDFSVLLKENIAECLKDSLHETRITSNADTLWLDASQARFFLVPDGEELPAGDFAIRNLLTLRKAVDPAALLPFEVTREQADQHIRGQFTQFADVLKGALAGLLTKLQDPVSVKEAGPPSPAPSAAAPVGAPPSVVSAQSAASEATPPQDDASAASARISHGAALVEQGIDEFFSGVKQAMKEALIPKSKTAS